VGNEYGKKATVKGLISTALAATTCSCMIGNGINCVYTLPDIITLLQMNAIFSQLIIPPFFFVY
jgi:hypothetical protein